MMQTEKLLYPAAHYLVKLHQCLSNLQLNGTLIPNLLRYFKTNKQTFLLLFSNARQAKNPLTAIYEGKIRLSLVQNTAKQNTG